jgi:hypothetical protein
MVVYWIVVFLICHPGGRTVPTYRGSSDALPDAIKGGPRYNVNKSCFMWGAMGQRPSRSLIAMTANPSNEGRKRQALIDLGNRACPFQSPHDG